MKTATNFEAWMFQVDRYFQVRLMGLDTSDLPDRCYRDMYEDGYAPEDVYQEVVSELEDEMGFGEEMYEDG